MKRVFLTAFAGALLLSSCGNEATDEVMVEEEMTVVNYQLDKEASTIGWTGRKNTEGDFHTGTLKLSSGMVEVTNGEITSGEFTVDMKTITATDEGLPEDKKQYLASHLSNADFFDVEQFPAVEVVVGTMKDGKLPTTLTVMGKEFKQDVPVKVTSEGDQLMISGDFSMAFDALESPGFMQDPKTKEQILKTFDFQLNLVLKK